MDNINYIKQKIENNNLILKALKFIPSSLIYSKDFFMIKQMLEINEKSDLDSKKNIDRLIRQRLYIVLTEALKNVPFYKENIKIKSNSFSEKDVFEVIKEFPYLEKEIIMANPELFINANYNKNSLILGTSGGSTGQGISIYKSKREFDIERAFYEHEWGKVGFSFFKSRILRIGTDAKRTADEIPWRIKGNRLLISPYHLNNKWGDIIYEKIIKFKPDFFHGYPSTLEYLARYILETKKKPISFKGILLASEMMTNDQFKLFNKVFNTHVSISYGLTERTNLAFSGINKNTKTFYYKLNDLYGYSENYITDEGLFEIVGTSLWNSAMPLIRYRTQDIGKIDDGIITKLDGRSQDFLIGKNKERVPGFSISIDKFTWDFVKQFQVYQNIPGKIVIKIVPRSNYSKEIETRILLGHLERWGGFFDISIEVVENISRTKSGKLRLIVNDIK